MFGDATALYERARNWTVGSDPGLLRLGMATRTTGALATALLALFLLTKATGQPLTVALLGVLISMISARSVNEPDPRRQRITMALLPLPTALGMVTFMSYFFSLYLRAKFSELPWLIGATLVGSLCSFVWSVFLMPDRPESVLRETIRSLRARMAIVVDTTADIVRHGLRMLAASDRYARILVRSSETRIDAFTELADAIMATTRQIRRNIDVLVTSLEFNQPATVFPSTDFIDVAESLARQHHDQPMAPERRRLLAALHSLRQVPTMARYSKTKSIGRPTTGCNVLGCVSHFARTHCRARPRSVG